MKGYYNNSGYMGYVGGRWVLFAYESGSTAAASSVVADDSNINPEDVAAVSEAAKETAA